jgi:hypothetical protein
LDLQEVWERFQKGLIMLKNISDSYSAYDQVATPLAGATVPAGKGGRGAEDTLKAKHTTEAVRDAKEVPNATLKAVHTQAGKAWDNETHPNSGADCE